MGEAGDLGVRDDGDAPVSARRVPVAAIGASAGGLEAMQQLLAAIPADSGIAFVVVPHQHPTQPTVLVDLLARHAAIKVVAAADCMRLEPDRVYVNPPGHEPSVEDGVLHLRAAHERARLPIDHFFRSLARACGEDAIAIVLSGTGNDGTLGIAEIKEAGGLVAAQEPATAEYAGMPESAIATHLVDIVGSPQQIAEQLVRYVRRPAGAAVAPSDLDALQRVLGVLRNRTGHDFTAYKRSTMRRRIERRMVVCGIDSVPEYVRFLTSSPSEIDALFKELLISVTSFFRDPEVFAVLRAELLTLVEQMPQRTLRAWVAGCATGEEAYSLAILLQEVQAQARTNHPLQIFATDLDQHALDVARAGRYPAGIIADVSAERLARFFTPDEDEAGFRIAKEVRETVVFAAQNVLGDPPFTRLDVATCRNLLIYLEPEAQRRVLAMFGYALRPGGMLVLGSSESVAGLDDVFDAIDQKSKVYRRRTTRVPVPISLPARMRFYDNRAESSAPQAAAVGSAIDRALLAAFAPPSVLVNEHGQILYIHGRTGDFLEPAAGAPTDNLFAMAREGLRGELSAAVREAAAGQLVVRRGLQVKTGAGRATVTLRARCLDEPESLHGLVLVSFEVESKSGRRRKASGQPDEEREDHAALLERDIERLRASLNGKVEQLATSNEELQSINEELQSTNEELETSREELQSLNEELLTVNAELAERNTSLQKANQEVQDLVDSTGVAIVFLDPSLAIKRFTKEARKIFSVLDTDIGRPLADLSPRLSYEHLLDDAREVLKTGIPADREVQTTTGAWCNMRILPHRSAAGIVDGLVLTFIDIDASKRRELAALKQ